MSSERELEVATLTAYMPWIQRDEAERLLEAFGGDAESVMRHLEATADAHGRQHDQQPQQPPQGQSKKAEKHFVGGGPSSGQAVVAGAPPQVGSVSSVIDSLFDRLRHNAEGDEDESPTAPSAFFGRGRRLGHTTAPSPHIASSLRQHRTVVVTVYQNGFRVEDGPLLQHNSSAGAKFFQALQAGVIPESLATTYPNTDISVKLSDCTNQEYAPPAYTPFAGGGHRLTSAPPSASGATAAATSPGSAERGNSFRLHDDEETAKLAIVNFLGDRTEITVNPLRHTVGDLFAVAMQRVQPGTLAFQLVVRDVPPRLLLDKSLTVDAAKLRNTTIMMRRA